MFRAQRFYERYGGEAAYWVDNPLLHFEHGAMTHLVQDLVVGRGLKAAGKRLTGPGFRARLGRLRGSVGRAEFETAEAATFLDKGPFARVDETSLGIGDYVWRLTYDYFEANPKHINQPEAIGAILDKLIFSPH